MSWRIWQSECLRMSLAISLWTQPTLTVIPTPGHGQRVRLPASTMAEQMAQLIDRM